MYKNITGIILSGGKSSRMGENKSLMMINEITVIERVANLMKFLFPEILLITNTPGEYKFLNIPIYRDIFTYQGPLAGIHAGLFHSKTKKNFIISCDLPLMTEEIIDYIINFKTDKPVTICKADGYIQQLVGLYDKSVLPAIESIFKEKMNEAVHKNDQSKRMCRVLSLLDVTGAEIIDVEKLPFYKKDEFFNMNRVEDYEKVLKIIKLN